MKTEKIYGASLREANATVKIVQNLYRYFDEREGDLSLDELARMSEEVLKVADSLALQVNELKAVVRGKN